VPAKLIVDGKTYPGVGVHFRGASSYMMVGEGRKRSFNLSIDSEREEQRLLGFRTVNLLNAHRDPTFLRTVLYYHIARHYLPAPKANYIRLVVNGESWGVYVNAQQFNKDFIKEWFSDARGARWKVPGSPRGNAGLAYLGDDPAEYKRKYEIKTRDDPKAWSDLIRLCRTLNKTPLDKLEAELSPWLDLDQALWFLAIENVFINSDGYWIRASDYELYQDSKGQFHIIPYDANETFNYPERGGRMGGGQEIRGVELDPMAGSADSSKPLLHRLLAVPALKARYLAHVRTLAEEWLDWKRLGPIASQYQALIADEVKADTRKLSSFEAFQRGVSEDVEQEGFRGPERALSLKNFAEQRRAYLLGLPEVRSAGR
jgi:spore coat protein CotH